MNLNQISIKNFILALFKRDDGERILLGSGAYEFDAELQHFAANVIANDVIEKQGTDGQLLAGQVRRCAPQSFDGFVGDASTSREDTENYRRAFIRFFQPRHFYTVVYILPDGTAIQRKNGYLTDAPAVPEQYQKSPRYHVALAFEDLNYYSYAEDAQGEETYAQTVNLQPESELTGGLVWGETTGLTIGQIDGDTEQTGTPSPSSPQTIKVVKGEQVVVIDGKDYALSLGSIVLRKLSTAQDYIYKDGANWKLHKATDYATIDSLSDGTSFTIDTSSTNTTRVLINFCLNGQGIYSPVGLRMAAKCNYLPTQQNFSTDIVGFSIDTNSGLTKNGIFFRVNKSQIGTTQAQVETWLNAHPLNVHYVLATATETTITNAVLIKQLNAINAALHSSTTAPTITAIGSDALPATITTNIFTTADGVVWTAEKPAGKNLLQLEPRPGLNQGLTASLASNGGIHIAGTATMSYMDMTLRRPLQLPAGDYTFSITQARTKNISIRLYPSDGGSGQDKVITAGSTKISFTISKPMKAAYLFIATRSGTTYDETIQPMLEKGSDATAFEPYRPAGGAVWDEETGHATTTITVNGLYAVNPIWTVPGPAESPLIENITNNTSLSYLGQIPAGQSLIIDCGNQTATIAGANVKNNIRGTWQTFEPGQTTIRYSGANITAPSTLEWNEVVG